MINFYNEADNALYKLPNSQFITQDRFRGDVAPNPEEIEEVTETFGIPATTVFQNNGGGNGGGNFITNYDTGRNYQPGGKYESHPLMSGALQERYDNDGNLVPNYNYGSSMGSIRPGRSEFSPLELSYMSELPESGQNLSRMEKLNMMARNFKGINSNYEDYRTTGKLGEYANKGIGMIPLANKFITGLRDTLGLPSIGDKSDRQRWAVDGAGYGQGTGRDEFGVYTGGKTMMGTTADYKTRMEAKVKDLEKFFKDGTKTNSTLKAQLEDYKEKLGILEDEEKVKGYQGRDRRVDLARIQKALGTKKGTPTINNIHGGDGITTGAATTTDAATTTGDGNRGSFTGQHPDTPKGGSPAQQSGGWHPGVKDGGRIGYFFGGLAARGMKR